MIRRAEDHGFEVLLTTDKNIRYQQNLAGRRLALLVLSRPQWPDVRRSLAHIAEAVNSALPGSYLEIDIASRDE